MCETSSPGDFGGLHRREGCYVVFARMRALSFADGCSVDRSRGLEFLRYPWLDLDPGRFDAKNSRWVLGRRVGPSKAWN